MKIEISTRRVIADDGSLVFQGSNTNYVNINIDGSVEGLTETSKQLISDFDLNSPEEIRYRFLLNLINDHAKRQISVPQLSRPIANFWYSLLRNGALNRNSHKYKSHTSIDNFVRMMTYANVVTTLECFFSDYLISYIEEKESVLDSWSLIYSSINGKKTRLQKLVSQGKVEKNAIIDELRELTLHNLSRVETIFTDAFGVTFPSYSHLENAIRLRHNIIHRNGADKDRTIEEMQVTRPDSFLIMGKNEVLHLLLDVLEFVNSFLDAMESRP